jgi:hypothetical protein
VSSRTKSLRIPARLRAAVIGGVAAVACSSAPTVPPEDGGPPSSDGSSFSDRFSAPDGPRYAPFDGGPCTIEVPAGDVCKTTCYNISTETPSPYICQVYCAPPDDAGPGSCSCNGGVALEGGTGFCPDGLNCELEATDDGPLVLC